MVYIDYCNVGFIWLSYSTRRRRKRYQMTNNFVGMLNPQMLDGYKALMQQAQASGNPQQFLMQRFGNNPQFIEGMKIFNEQGIDGLNKFISSQFSR